MTVNQENIFVALFDHLQAKAEGRVPYLRVFDNDGRGPDILLGAKEKRHAAEVLRSTRTVSPGKSVIIPFLK